MESNSCCAKTPTDVVLKFMTATKLDMVYGDL